MIRQKKTNKAQDSNRFQKILEDSKRFQKVKKDSKRSQKII